MPGDPYCAVHGWSPCSCSQLPAQGVARPTNFLTLQMIDALEAQVKMLEGLVGPNHERLKKLEEWQAKAETFDFGKGD